MTAAGNTNLPARREDNAIDLTRPLRNLDEVRAVVQFLGTADALPQALRGKPASLAWVILMGQELGLTLTQAVREIYVPAAGSPQLRGELLLAKLREAGHSYTYDLNETSCTFTVIRGDTKEQYKGSFSLAQAVQAGLVTEKDGKYYARSQQGRPLPWELFQEDMLLWRAAARAVRRGAPEVSMGWRLQGEGGDDEPGPVTLEPKPMGAAQASPETAHTAPTSPAQATARSTTQAKEDTTTAGDQVYDTVVMDLHTIDQAMAQRSHESHEGSGHERHESQGGRGPRPNEGTQAKEHTGRQPAPAPAARPGGGNLPQLTRSERGRLLAAFATLGWDWDRHRSDVLRACTMFVRRPVSSGSDLASGEAQALGKALDTMAAKVSAEHQPVALADSVEKWRQNWQQHDPESYQAAGLWDS